MLTRRFGASGDEAWDGHGGGKGYECVGGEDIESLGRDEA